MAKVLIMVRTSTEAQSTEDQKREMYEFCKSEGYAEKDIVCVEKQGASAAKVDDDYREMIDEVKMRIEEDPEIRCCAVWHLNRAFRTEEVYIELKSFCLKHQVQIICKNPYLKLLTPDGRIDAGMELAMGLLAILAKQDQEERKAKFKRAKTSMLKKGQYIGGNVRRYGYKIEGKDFVEDDVEGPIVRTIFGLYSTGSYSTYTLSLELKERGIDITDNKVSKILRSPAYVGDEVSENGMHYPALVSRETFDRCQEIRQRNKIDMKRGERIVLGAKLVKCPVCGATCTSSSRHYVCCRHAHRGPCPNGFALRQEVADDLLWRTSYPIHLQYLMDASEGKMEGYRMELEVLDEKIAAAEAKMDDFAAKKERIVDSFMDGLITKENRDLRLSKLADDVRVHRDRLTSLQGKREAIARLLEVSSEDTYESFLSSFANMELEDRFKVIHQHIESLVATQESFGRRDPRTTRPNAVRIKVRSITGETWQYMYIPKFYNNHNLYVWNGRKWIGDRVSTVR